MNKKTKKNSILLKKLYFDFVKKFSFQLLIAFFLLVLVSLTASAYPYLIQNVFDKLIDNKVSWEHLPILIAVLALIRGLGMYYQIKVVSKIALSIGLDIQKKLSNHILTSDLLDIMDIASGNHISRIMNDVNLLREGIERSINNLIRDTLTIIILVIYLFWLDWILTLFVIILYPLALRPIINIGKKQRNFAFNLQNHLEDLTSFLSEIFRSIKMIKSYSLEKNEKERIDNSLTTLFKNMYDIVIGRAKILPILEVLGGVVAAVVIYIASYRVVIGELSPGSVIGFVTALLMISQPARALGTFNTVVQEGLSALERIYMQLDKKPVIEKKMLFKQKTIIPKSPSIRFKNVSFHFDKNVKIIDNFTIDIRNKEKLAIIGKSGSGKSTILNLLSRFFDPCEGTIEINNKNLKNFDLHSLRKLITLVSQDIVIYDDTFFNNIKIGNFNASDQEVINAAKKSQLHEFISSLPKGYNTIVGESGNYLSGGQRQRLSIARAFLKNSPILLLDEVTSSLDKETSGSLMKSLNELAVKKTCIVVTHDTENLFSVDKILLMDSGKIIHKQKNFRKNNA